MSVLPHETMSEKAYWKFVQEKARIALLMELRDYDWMALDLATAQRIRDLLPPIH